MVPGNSLNTYRPEIDNYISENKPVVISVNFVADYSEAMAFFGNAKRYSRLKGKREGRMVIISSNIKSDTKRILWLTITVLLIVDINILKILQLCY